MATLTITTGPAQGQSIECDREIVIGREGVDLVVDDDEASRRHTAIRPGPGGIEVEDLGSLNGTFIDGQRISEVTTLTSSAKLRVGQTHLELEVTQSDLPVAQPQRTVLSDKPVIDIGERTVMRDRPVIDVGERTAIRDTPPAAAEPPPPEAPPPAPEPTPREAPIATPEATTVRPTVPAPPPPGPPPGAATPPPPGPPVAPAPPGPPLPPPSVRATGGVRRGGRQGPPAGARILIPIVVIAIIAVVVLLLTHVI